MGKIQEWYDSWLLEQAKQAVADKRFNPKPPKYIFHVSDKSNRKYILKFGLIPKSNVNEYGYYYGYDKPFIFATMKNNNLFMNNDNLDVWVIDTTKINNKWFFLRTSVK